MCPSSTSGMTDSGMETKSTEDASTVGPALWKRLSKIKWRISFTPIAKTSTKLDVLKQQSSNFTEMTSGRYVRRQSLLDAFTVDKLIVIANCKDIQYFFGLRQLHQPELPRLPITSVSQKISNCLQRDDNSIMSTCDMSKNERIILIFVTSRTALVMQIKFHSTVWFLYGSWIVRLLLKSCNKIFWNGMWKTF